MEHNPFKKIVTGVAVAGALTGAPTQEAIGADVAQDELENRTEYNIEANDLFNKIKEPINSLEKKLAEGKELIKLDKPSIAIYSADNLLKQTNFNSTPEYNSNYWASVLEVNLIENNPDMYCLDRSREGIGSFQKEEKLIDQGYIDTVSGPHMGYVAPDGKLVVAVDQVSKTVHVIIYNDNGMQEISVPIEGDLQQTEDNLTQQVLENIRK
ncbi:MAG: hypothetical protein RL641_217 [Candidatus Parcubacteria bacterium]|jgi:hypothetical protein